MAIRIIVVFLGCMVASYICINCNADDSGENLEEQLQQLPRESSKFEKFVLVTLLFTSWLLNAIRCILSRIPVLNLLVYSTFTLYRLNCITGIYVHLKLLEILHWWIENK